MGLIFRFHGHGGSADTFFRRVEERDFARAAVAAGYAVAALDSTDRVSKQWDPEPSETNIDVRRVATSIELFRRHGLATSNTPCFASGMSNGGGFTPKPAIFLKFKACAIHCSAGDAPAFYEKTTVPTIWSLAFLDDKLEHTDFLSQATTNMALLRARGIAAEVREHPPSPMYPLRFTRIPEVNNAASQSIFNALRGGGYLDKDSSAWTNALPGWALALTNDISIELRVGLLAHEYLSDDDNKVLQFFGRFRPPAAGRLAFTFTDWRPLSRSLVMSVAFNRYYRVYSP